MADLPASWGLKAQPRQDGKLDIVGKTDAGHDYRVRTTDGPSITDKDITELHDADRETYAGMSSHDAAKCAVAKIVNSGKAAKRAKDEEFGESLMEGAHEVAFAMFDRKGHSSPFTGSTYAFRQGWERAFGKEN